MALRVFVIVQDDRLGLTAPLRPVSLQLSRRELIFPERSFFTERHPDTPGQAPCCRYEGNQIIAPLKQIIITFKTNSKCVGPLC